MTIPNDAGVCHITIHVRHDALAQLLKALPVAFRIRLHPPHPDDPEYAGWQLDYRGVWTIEQDDILHDLDDLVYSWGRSGLPRRPTPGEE